MLNQGAKKTDWLAGAITIGIILIATASSLTVAQPVRQENLEEIVVSFDIPRLLRQDVFVQYDGQNVYLPVMDVFHLLDFNVNRDISGNVINGYLNDKDSKYEINIDSKTVKCGDREFPMLPGEYAAGDIDLYLRLDLFEVYFGLKMNFDFSKLQISLPLNKDFPAYLALLRKKERARLQVKKEELKDVRRMPLKRTVFNGGVLDWMISANPLGTTRTQYFDLGLGSIFLGGDLELSGGGDTRNGIQENQLRYHWHYFYDKSKYFTQVEAGQVYTGGALGRNLIGATVTNKPQVRRDYFQTIDLEDRIGENWEVELYIDNRLVDYQQTDETGRYHFNVDIMYGASTIMLKKYGPNGEFDSEEIHVRVPHNLLPKGEFEYSVSGGKMRGIDTTASYYAQGSCFYGVNTHVTGGVSVDVPVVADTGETPTAAAEMSLQPLANMTINSYYAFGYKASVGINFSQPSIVSINAYYTRYDTSSARNKTQQLDRVNFSISSPIKIGRQRFGLRCNASLDRFDELTTLSANYGFNASIAGMQTIYIGKYKHSTYKYVDFFQDDLLSQLIVSARIISWVRPQLRADYDHKLNEFYKYGAYLSKRVFRTGQVTLSYERNERTKSNLFMLTFNFLTDFADFTSRVLSSSNQVAWSQIQRGSVRYNDAVKSFHFDRRSGVGFGSAILRPFLDNNYNGVYDKNDSYIPGLKARVEGAGGRPIGKDRVYYYDHLRPYDEYLVQIDKYSLDNPLLKPTSENYKVAINPNMVTTIDVPMVTAGEVSGFVRRQLENGAAGLGGIKVLLINLETGRKTEVTSFNDGGYYYLGLIPGNYRAVVDPEQLETYGYITQPERIDFEVKKVEGGAVVENIDFLLIPGN